MIRDAIIIIGGIGIISYFMYQQIKAIWRGREMIKIMQNPMEYLKKNKKLMKGIKIEKEDKEEIKEKEDQRIGYI